MHRYFVYVAACVTNLALASSVFAGTVAAPAPRAGQTVAAGAASTGASFRGYLQAKGARPDAGLSGAFKVKLLNEYSHPAAKHTTGAAATADVEGFAALLPSKNRAIQGLVTAGQNNAVLQFGLKAQK